jgi:hypothetical protein
MAIKRTKNFIMVFIFFSFDGYYPVLPQYVDTLDVLGTPGTLGFSEVSPKRPNVMSLRSLSKLIPDWTGRMDFIIRSEGFL